MDATNSRTWIKTGVISGLALFVVYPVMILVSFPVQLTLVLACSFGFLFMMASIGLYAFLSMNGKSVSLQLGALFNIIACATIIMMLTIQLALFQARSSATIEATNEMKDYIFQFSNIIQLGLDVVWDIFIGVGTALLAINMFKHPRLGRIFSVTGIIVALTLLAFNIYFFPIPPAESGSIDLGPLVALWYLAVTIRMAMSFHWVDEKLKKVPPAS